MQQLIENNRIEGQKLEEENVQIINKLNKLATVINETIDHRRKYPQTFSLFTTFMILQSKNDYYDLETLYFTNQKEINRLKGENRRLWVLNLLYYKDQPIKNCS